MAATTAVGVGDVRGRPLRPEPLRLRLLELSFSLVVLAGLLWQVADNWSEFVSTASRLLPWLVIVLIADLLPVPDLGVG